ncbi:MAG: FAD-binding oxidoreductase, partial [Candidatus Binataceae bacterium]
TAEEAAELVRKCERDDLPLAPIGAARTLARIRKAPAAIGISLVRLNRVIAYEPDDMTIIAEAGITLADLDSRAEVHGQRLGLDPARPDRTTIGALIGAAKAGPLRLSEGLVRDRLIGVRFIGHQGRIIHAGGRVVKNVAGYDLMKVMAGSYGTLGIVTEAAFRLSPIPANYTIAMGTFSDCAALMAAAMRLRDGAPLIHLEAVSGAIARTLGRDRNFFVIAGFGGSDPEVAYTRDQISLAIGSDAVFIGGAEAASLYELLRDCVGDGVNAPPIAAEIAVPPAVLPHVLEQCACAFRAHAANGVAQLFEDLSSGNGAISEPAAIAATIARWRAIAREAGGHLRVIRIPPDARAQVAMFYDPPPIAFKLMRRLKASFDPMGIFNPGCFVGGL